MTTTPELAQRLRALQNRPTRYEAVVKHPNGRVALLGYSARHSRRGLLDMLHRHGLAVVHFLGLPDAVHIDNGREPVLRIRAVKGGPECGTVSWSGRTQRDAICSRAEHPFVVAIDAAGGVQ